MYGAGLVVGQVVSAITTPLFTRVLGATEFGSLELLTVTLTLISTCVLAGADLAAIRLFYESPHVQERRRVLSSGLLIVGALGLGALLVILPFARPLARVLLGSEDDVGTLLIAAVGVPVTALATYTIEILRLQRRPWAFLVSGLLRSALGGVLGAVLVWAFDAGVAGVYAGLLVGATVALTWNLAVGRKLVFPLRVSRATVRRLVAYGLPLVPAGLAGWSLMLVDRFALLRYRSLTEVGYYAVANRIANLMLLAVYGFRAGWAAYALELHERNPTQERRVRANALLQIAAGVGFLAVLLGGLSRELVLIVGGNQYLAAVPIVPPLAGALLLFATVPVTQTGLLIAHRTRAVGLHVAVAAVLNLVACIVLIPPYGLAGAAAANVIGFAYEGIAILLSAQKVDPAPFPLRRVAIALVVVVPYFFLAPVRIGTLLVSLVVKAMILATYPVVLIGMRVIPVREVTDLARRGMAQLARVRRSN